jgi:hypothetical protein
MSVQITVLYDKIGRRDAEIRKLLILNEEYKEYKLKLEEYKQQVLIQITEINADYTRQIEVLNVKILTMSKEYD